MNWKLLFSVLVPSISICLGCSSSSQVSLPSDLEQPLNAFNVDAYERSGSIEFQDGREVYGRNIRATPDSLYFIPWESSAMTALPLRTINKVVFKNHFIGYLEGFGLGALAGAVTIAAIYVAAGHADQGDSWFTFILAAAAGAGGLIGGLPGLIIGHSYEYRFVQSPGRTK